MNMTRFEFRTVISVFVLAALAALIAILIADRGSKGVWAWGILTAALAVAVILVVTFGWPKAVYDRVEKSASAVGAVVAASALAWSFFYNAAPDSKENTDHSAAVQAAILDAKSELKTEITSLRDVLVETQTLVRSLNHGSAVSSDASTSSGHKSGESDKD